jgi:hypothetical protein
MSAMTQAEQLKEKVRELQSMLLSSHPQMPTLLRTIHSALRADPDMVTLLEPEEIGVIVSGLQKQTMTTIAGTVAKSKTKKASSIGLLDL